MSLYNTSKSQSLSKGNSSDLDLSRKGGYGCALYQDYLVLLGSRSSGQPESSICVFNLKEQKAEESGQERIPAALLLNSACAPVIRDQQMVYCHPQTALGMNGGYAFGAANSENRCTSLLIRMEKDGDHLRYNLEPAMPGPGTSSSICHVYEDKIYVYDPSSENSNFGCLHWFSIVGGGRWDKFQANPDNIKKSEGRSTWERVSPSGQVPGGLSNISLAEANGVIYVFGSSEEKSVLWVFNINDKEWKQVRDTKTLIAGPNQKAVIYKGQLLIVDWGYSRDSVGIQYFDLDDLKFVEPSTNSKETCKDQAENFIQDTKNLYTGRFFHDVVFEVEGEQIPAHKAILAHRSDYFMKMFTSGMSESYSAKIPIPNMKSHVFKALLQYIYCNEVELDEQLALDLIPTVDEYVMKGLKGLCEKYLCKQLRKENVVDMLIVADRHEIEELKKACFKFILKNLGNIDKNEEMNKLSKSLFIELLKFSTAPNTEKKEKAAHKEDPYQQEKYATQKKASSSSLFNGNKPSAYGGGGGGGGGLCGGR